ncbi:MAG: proline dehydrogenase family protein [Candidatus Bathyarchaeia archaeon]
MESSRFTQSTLDIYAALRAKFLNVGVALQANLKRTEADLRRILKLGGTVRLVTGAYREGPKIAFTHAADVKHNFGRLMRVLFESTLPFALGTHDQLLIRDAANLAAANRGNVEFQMLMGIRDDLKLQLAKEGSRVAVYIPYGRKWLPYSMRRLRERKENILLIVQSLFTR